MKKILIVLMSSVLMSSLYAEPMLHGLRGEVIPLSSLKGKWVMINFWAPWCQPCLDEIVELNQFYTQQKANLYLFAVNYDTQSIEEQLTAIQRYQLQYPSIQDPSQALHLGDITGVPVTYVFSPDGQLQDALYGGQTQASLRLAMQRQYK